MGQDNFIELNGKRYDAATGNLLGKGRTPAQPMSGKVLDVFVQPKKSPSTRTTKPMPVAKEHRLKPHPQEHSKTLMRSTVHRPDVTLKPAMKLQTQAQVMAIPLKTIATKRSASQIDPSRAERAKQVAKHDGVRRFHSPQPIVHQFTLDSERQRAATNTAKPVAPPIAHVKRQSQLNTMLERAVANAKSHEQPMPKKPVSRKRRMANAWGVVAAFLVIAGFITYLNLPTINVKVASLQAGFSAHVPGYRPIGYNMSNTIRHHESEVTLAFYSGDSTYQITQRPSDWNSQTLLDNAVALTGKHQTLASKGRTIYVYNNHNATWVDGGIRYDITGNAELSSGDIISIADSL